MTLLPTKESCSGQLWQERLELPSDDMAVLGGIGHA